MDFTAINFERPFAATNRLLQVLARVTFDTVPIDVRQVILNTCPPFGKGLKRVNFQSLQRTINSLLQVLSPIIDDAFSICIRQIVLYVGPPFGKGLTRID